MTQQNTPAGWYPDPTGRNESRYFNGQWTQHVSTRGVNSVDPLNTAPPPSMSTPFGRPPFVQGAAVPPTPQHRGLWIGGGVVLGVVGVVIVAAIAAGSGAGGGSGSGQTVDYVQYETDQDVADSHVELGMLDSYDLNQNDIGAYPIFASDCRGAASDLRNLRADTATWPDVLQAPMSRAETEFAAAIAACSANKLATMKADMTKGDRDLVAVQHAFAAHCNPSSGSDPTRWQC